ncbi:MAG: RNA polymerase sigma-70 factor [Mangrovibacterium sp.]
MSRHHQNNDLLESLKGGKESSFRIIFTTYFESLEVFAKVYVMDQQIAKDMVQEVFLNLWTRRHALSEDVNIKAYLYQATKNNCLNYLKRLKVESKYEEWTLKNYHDLLLNYEALSQLNVEPLLFDELMQTINNAIDHLPQKCREVFELSRYEKMKNREIAEELNISVKAVEGHISNALRHLKDRINKYYSSKLILFLFSKIK